MEMHKDGPAFESLPMKKDGPAVEGCIIPVVTDIHPKNRKYRKLPVVIEAVQLTWATWDEICDFVPDKWFVRGCFLDENNQPLPVNRRSEKIGLILRTLESNEFVATQGDYIIKGVNGEFYACKPDIFWKTYEKAE